MPVMSGEKRRSSVAKRRTLKNAVKRAAKAAKRVRNNVGMTSL